MHTITTRTLATTAALALVGGLASGVLVTLALTAQAPVPTPTTVTVQVPTACPEQDSLTARTLANYDVALDLWASGAEYTPEFRSDNLDVLIYQADNLACN